MFICTSFKLPYLAFERQRGDLSLEQLSLLILADACSRSVITSPNSPPMLQPGHLHPHSDPVHTAHILKWTITILVEKYVSQVSFGVVEIGLEKTTSHGTWFKNDSL